MPLQKKKDKYENPAKQKTDWSPNTVRATTEQLEGFRNAQKPRKQALVDEYQNRKRVDEYNKKQERDKKSSIMQGIRMSYEKEMRKQGVLVNADPAVDKMTQQRFGALDALAREMTGAAPEIKAPINPNPIDYVNDTTGYKVADQKSYKLKELSRDKYNAMMANDDFEELSKYSGAEYNPGYIGMPGAGKRGKDSVWNVIGDVDYEALYHMVNGNPSGAAAWSNAKKTKDYENADFLNDDEKRIISYLYNKGDYEGIDEYVRSLDTPLTERRYQDTVRQANEFANDYPEAANALTVALAPAKGAAAVAQFGDTLRGNADPHANYNLINNYVNTIRGNVGERFGNWAENATNGVVSSEFANNAYGIGMSMADSAVNMALGAGIGNALAGAGAGVESAKKGAEIASQLIMSSGAAADTMIDSLEKGKDPTDAFLLSFWAGTAEYVTENFGIEALFDTDALRESAVKYVAKNMLFEGSEELFSDIINNTADLAVLGNESDFMALVRKYQEENPSLTTAQAVGKAFGSQAIDAGKSFIGGAISGGLFAAGGVGMNNFRQIDAGRRVNNSANSNEKLYKIAEDAIDNAKTMELNAGTESEKAFAASESKRADEFLQKVVEADDSGKQISSREIGQQMQINQDNVNETILPKYEKEVDRTNEAYKVLDKAIEASAKTDGVITLEDAVNVLNDDAAVEMIARATGKDFNSLPLEEAIGAVQDFVKDAGREYRTNQAISEFGKGMGENGARVLNNSYAESGIENAADYTDAVNSYYSYGANMESTANTDISSIIDAVGKDINPEVAMAAVFAGFNDKTEGTIVAGGLNEKATEKSGTSGQRWKYGLAQGKSGSGVQGGREKTGAGTAAGGLREQSTRAIVNAQIRDLGTEKVSSNDLAEYGVAFGTDKKNNYIINPSYYTSEMKAVEGRNKTLGYKTVFVSGTIETYTHDKAGNRMQDKNGKDMTELARGVFIPSTKTIILQADNRNLSIDKISRHEYFHMLFSDMNSEEHARAINEAKTALISQGFDESNIDQLAKAYMRKYGWNNLNMTNEDILEEILADAYAGIDVWDYVTSMAGATKYTDAVRKYADELLERVGNHEAIDIEDQHRFSRELDDELFEKAREENKENKYVAAAVMRQAGLDRAEIKKILDKVPKNLLPEEKGNLSGVDRDEYGNKKFTVYGNSSYSKSVENTSVCIRSLAMERLFDQAAKKFGHSLTTDEAITLSQMAWELTDEPTCQYCYVFADRVAERNARNQYIEQRNDAVEKLKKASIPRVPTADELNYSVKGKSGKFSLKDAVKAHPELEDVYKVYNDFGAGRKNTPNMQERFIRFVDSVKNGTELVSAADVTTDEAMLEAEKKGGAIADEIADIRRYASNASHAKAKVAYTAYNNDILNFSADLVIELNKEYGLRFYSYSDYHPAFLLENMQMYTDAAVKGLKGLAYTKDIDYARIFEPTGANINISTKTMDKPVRWDSLTAEQQEEYSYMTPVNGMVYMPDEMQGANLKESIALRQRSIENGTGISVIMVCTSDAQVEWAMKQEWCDVIIPYHVVFSQAIKDTFLWKNYKAWQEDKKIRGKWHEGNAKHITPIMHGNDLNTYLQALEENNLSPRFEQWLKKDPANYMKLVNETRRSYRDTQALQPIFNMEEARKVGEKLENGKGYDWFGHYLSENEDVAEEYAERYNNGERYNASVGGFTDKETAKLDHDYAVAIDTLNSDTATRAAKNKAQKYLDGVKAQYGFSEAVEYDSNGNPVALSKRIQQDGVQRFSVEIEYADGTKESYTNPSEVTDEEAIHYLTLVKKRKLKDYTYFPVMGNTPSVILDSIKEYGLKAENLPLVMQADKAWQAMDERNRGASKKKYGSNIRGHALSPQMVLNVIKALEHPTDIVYQTNRFNSKGEQLENNFAIFVDLGNDEGVAIVELDAKFSDGVIGENGEQKFNTVVTTFIPDTERDGIEFDYAEHLLNNPNNDRVTIVEKATHEDLHRLDSRTDLDESLNDSISDSSSKVKHSTEDSDGNTLTPQQREYFRDSKIRDENGNLIVMYHGSESTFTTFENRPARNGRKYGDGFYFTEDKKAARSWGKGKVYKTYLNITNPLTVSANEAVPEALDNALRLQYGDLYDELSANPKWFGNEYTREEYIENEMKYITNSQEAFFALEGGNDYLKAFGYDGIIVPAESYMGGRYSEVIAFDSNQIKNSTNKKPTEDADIRYSREMDAEAKVNFGSMFSGTGTVDFAIRNMVNHRFAVEYDGQIAGVYKMNNGENIFIGDVRDAVKQGYLEDKQVEYFHASPVCKNFSSQKTDAGEQPLDIATAKAVADGIDSLQPKIFTLENVKGYKNSRAVQLVIDALKRNGYAFDENVYRASDYGGSTIRERYFIRAVKDASEMPPLPEKKQGASWYDTISDLIPELPEWPMKPGGYMETRWNAIKDDIDTSKPVLILRGTKGGSLVYAEADEFSPTIIASDSEARIFMPDGRVLRATPRVLARIQGLPDSFQLPKQTSLANKVIGNGIPVQLTQAVAGSLLPQVDGVNDVRFSTEDADGNALSEQQQEYFRDSKVRDDNGRLKVMYHGTSNSGFTVFEYGKMKFGLFGEGFYFTDDENVAEGYSKAGRGGAGTPGIYKTYLNITNPIDMDAEADVDTWVKTIAEYFGEMKSYVRSFIDASKFVGDGPEVRNYNMFEALKDIMSDQMLMKYEAGEAAQDILRAMGYDGITHVGGGRYNKYDENRHRVYIAFEQEQIKNIDNVEPTADPDIRFSRETDKETLEFLNGQELVPVYRAMQLIDGKLYPPMAAIVNGSLVEPAEPGAWYRADEHPELIKLNDKGKPQFNLNKGNGKGLDAAYNPYWHTSSTPLNDQFTSAYDRPNLVVVKGYVPKSELTSGYRAQYAKDPVGVAKWHAGTVDGKLRKIGKGRQVILSRYFMLDDDPVVSEKEAASFIREQIGDSGITVPWNVVTPSLRKALEAEGVTIDRTPAGRTARTYDQQIEYERQQRMSQESDDFAERTIREENDYLKGAYASLLTEVRTNKGSAAKMRTNANKVSDGIREAYESRIDKNDLRARINRLVQDYIIGGEQNEAMAYDNAKNEAVNIARDIINNAGRLKNADEYDRYLDLKKRLKNNDGIYLDPSLRGDPEKYQEIRKRLFGTMNIKNSGTALDTFYSGLVNDFGELFSAEAAPGIDQLQAIEEVLNTLAPIYENPYNGKIAEAIEICANDILMSLNNGSIIPDSQAQNARQQAKMEKVRQDSIDYARRAIAAERVHEQKRIDRALDYYKNRDLRKADNAEREKLRRIANRLNNRKLPAVTRALVEQYIGDLDLISVRLTNKRLENLKDLRLWYEDQQTNNPDFVKDPEIEKLLQRLSTRQISELNIEEVRWLTTCLQNIENELAIAKKTIDTEDQRDIHIQADESMNDIDHSKGNGNNAFTQGIDSFFVNGTLSPIRAVKRMVGYNTESPIFKRTVELEQGQIKSFDWQRKAEANFLRWTNDKKFMRSITGKNAELIDIGNGAKITPAMRMSLYLHSKNEQNMRHIIYGGITVPDMKRYKDGNMAKAYGKGAQTIKLNAKQVREIVAGMTEQEKAFADAAADYFNGMSQESINEVSEKLKGYSLALVQNYFPINTNSNFTLADYETVKMDGTIEGMGFLKERQNASNPIYLRDITDVLNKSISSTAKYVGLAIPVRNFNKIYNVSSSEFGDEAKAALEEMKNAKSLKERYAARDRMREARELFTGSMRESVMQNWDVEGIEYIENMMADIQNPRGSRSAWAKLFQNVRGNYAGSVLGLSASVAMKQAASYPTAAAVLGWKPLNQAFLDVHKIGKKFDMNLVNRYTPLLWHRASNFNVQYLGNVGTAVNQNKIQELLSSKALNWITDMDVATTRLLWFASEHYVQNENKALVKGSDVYYREVAEIYNRVITETQPNYTTMERPQLLRTDDTLLSSMMMFKTQSFQNFNVLYDAIGNYSAMKDAVKILDSEENRTALTNAKKGLSRAVSSQVVQTFVFAAMTAVCAAILGRKDKYKDDEGEVTMESLAKQVGKDMLSGAMSMVPFGGELYNVLARVLWNEKYYGFDNITASSLDDMFNAFIKAADSVKNGASALLKIKDADGNVPEWNWNEQRINMDSVLNAVTKVYGIPYDNASKILEAAVQHVAKGTMGEYEGTYTYLRLTKKMSDTGAYYDNLFKAYENDRKSYDDLKKKMIADGFDEEKMRNAVNNRLKKAAGVASVSDLDHKLVDPAYQSEYDTAIDMLLKSPEYKKLDSGEQDKRRSAVETTLKDPDKVSKLDKAGLDVTTYSLYTTARKLADVQGDNNGSYNKDEKEAAIKMLLNSKEITSAEASKLRKYDK